MYSKVCSAVVVSLLGLIASPAFAWVGSVKVDCGESCHNVPVGAVCDAYVQHSRPIAIACDDTATPGFGRTHPCGAGITCTSYGSLSQSDPVGAYCDPGPGNDAIVTCIMGSVASDDETGDPEEGWTEPGFEDKVTSDAVPLPRDEEELPLQ